MALKANYDEVLSQLPPQVQLVAVSKTHPVEKIKTIYDCGQRIFGENKVQELVEKYPLLPKDIQWHLIGHLQTNKVKYIAEFVDTIQSVDSEKLLREIDKQAARYGRKIKVLLQVKIAEEDTKFGLESSVAETLFHQWLEGAFPHVVVTGLMGMATFTDDREQIRREFCFLKSLYDRLALQHPLQTLSMGMSGDFPLAVDCGANSVRVGSAIFGDRSYSNGVPL
ncbi:YggS family pyridoxal phosphate-dependent enzyme [Bergeyella sp. RCAD1439]|uniref:YggS family pyridoxal phosphate-dependent enzyme n=1 Tax=Bergeyella anatis TaxID=3113737 RepID=UPI002E1722A4|nr:YggS family pyridoxal phosphate-dependent enzyme [Bergeyella sp. RCAD1439]